MKREIRNLLGSPSGALRVTTMVDLFKVASDFPGLNEMRKTASPLEVVQRLERRFSEDIADARFVPYLQLHEFEALLLWDVQLLEKQHPNRARELRKLGQRLRKEFRNSEDVNRRRPPSLRIKEAVPEYEKVKDGIATVERIGLERLRLNCPHFGDWIDRIERSVSQNGV